MTEKFIVKRSGDREIYQPDKIKGAIRKSFASCGTESGEEQLQALCLSVEEKLEKRNADSVELIQDVVEETLMEQGFFQEAKSYILYRQKRTELRRVRQEIENEVRVEGLSEILKDIQQAFPPDVGDFALTAGAQGAAVVFVAGHQ